MTNKRIVFRQQAIDSYQHNREVTLQPKFASPRTLLFCWVLIFVFAGTIFWAWSSMTLPQVEQGSGTVRVMTASSLQRYGLLDKTQKMEVIALLFLPDRVKDRVHVGTVAQMQIAGMRSPIQGTIERGEEISLTIEQARQRYQLNKQDLATLPRPAFVAFLSLSNVGANVDGRDVRATIPLDASNVLSLFFLKQKS